MSTRPNSTLPPPVGLSVGTTAKMLKNGVFQPFFAEEAVIGEPVSARWFPVPRENTGKFADFGLEVAEAPRLSEENATLTNRIP
jgi:hypothetical protein